MERLHENSLAEETHYILEEARIVVPGLQALFGFQLIAVFNQTFSEKLSTEEQWLHLLSIIFVCIAIVLVMTPTALHRIGEHGKLTRGFAKRSSRLLKWAMFFLPLGICSDFYLISRIITESIVFSAVATACLLCLCLGFWYLLPKYFSKRPAQ